MQIEPINESNLKVLTGLFVEMFPQTDYHAEYVILGKSIGSENEIYFESGLCGRLRSISKNCITLASDTAINNNDSIHFHRNVGFEEVNRIVCFIKPLR